MKTTVRVELDLHESLRCLQILAPEFHESALSGDESMVTLCASIDYHWCCNLRHCMVDDSLGHMRQISHEGGPHHIFATSEREVSQSSKIKVQTVIMNESRVANLCMFRRCAQVRRLRTTTTNEVRVHEACHVLG